MEAKQYASKQPSGSLKKSNRKYKIKYLETNENKNSMIQNLCDAAKAVLRGKFIVIQTYHGKPEQSPVT